MKARVEPDKILSVLRNVIDPNSGRDIVSLNMVSGVQVSAQGDVIFMIEVDPSQGSTMETVRQQAEKIVSQIPNIGKVSAILTAERKERNAPPPPTAARKPPQKIPGLLPKVKHLVAIASGKGGVGKSTVTANIATILAKNGLKVGLLDADIYGPSQPRMMGLEGQKPGGEDGRIDPLMAHGVKVMSIGFMVDSNAPLIWRGPMVQSALVQLMRDVDWGELDILLVDMPPGTGDAQLTMAQKVPLSGAVIVSTPQDIALLDARKGTEMFRKVNVPILGMIENMSTHICSNCGHEDHIFGSGGARKESEHLDVPFLGEIPLERSIRLQSDDGLPVCISGASETVSKTYANIADGLMKQIAMLKP